MAPYAEEIDVYKVPHSRIKKLVNLYLNKASTTNFSNDTAMLQLLRELSSTFHEFKCHEQIENEIIIKELKNKMNTSCDNTTYQTSPPDELISNNVGRQTVSSSETQIVCNCHNDNKLVDMLALFEDGYHCHSANERVSYGHHLVEALNEFTQHFLPHMEEEEEVFQPLLMRCFSYEELKELKARVLEKHEITWAERDWCGGHEKFVEESLGTPDGEEGKVAEPEEAESAELSDEVCYISQLPSELLEQIFANLSVKDVCSASATCNQWYDTIYSSKLIWHELQPYSWWYNDYDARDKAAYASITSSHKYMKFMDEDADIDESCNNYDDDDDSDNDGCSSAMSVLHSESIKLHAINRYLLPKIGKYVEILNVSNLKGLSSSILSKMLSHCAPSLTKLVTSDTNITDAAFKSLSCEYYDITLPKLEVLDLSGCISLTDLSIERIMTAVTRYTKPVDIDSFPFSPIICSNCPVRHMCSMDTNTPPSYCPAVRNHHQSDLTSTLHSPQLTTISLNGCHLVTDTGLRLLSGLPLTTLDLSGCPLLTGPSLVYLTSTWSNLSPHWISYCDNITDGPYQSQAGQCNNLEPDASGRYCCRSGR